MKIYTKTGDTGQTGLVGGSRVWKNNPRLEAYGTIDELNSFIGLLNTHQLSEQASAFIQNIQHHLFVIGSNLATDQQKTNLKVASIVEEKDIIDLEVEIDGMDASLPQLTNFVLPGGAEGAAVAHLCRTVTRRAERRIMDLVQSGIEIDPLILKYVNRLSDYFFTLSRYITVNKGYKEILWKKKI